MKKYMNPVTAVTLVEAFALLVSVSGGSVPLNDVGPATPGDPLADPQ